MEDTVIVIMLKDEQGILDKELGVYKILQNDDVLVNIHAVASQEGLLICAKISTGRDVEDWEFSPIYDHYDTGVFGDEIKQIKEVDDCFNPTWELMFDLIDRTSAMEEKLNRILAIHKQELQDVYVMIKESV